ncbi:riboflavin biosynthesis protein RibF [Risungbinella massiliensis]|uniref:riboflavin biosynthesis protein RibF n=1 Tax=Risungbinella massiliensis TaxID=1329796 RepID=UPI0005CC2628|nr:riboflavin biosynthesis protein RibF [Risungbinella massiliensis]
METIHLRHPYQSTAHLDSPIVVALGFFDGVHLGHIGVLENAKRLAEQQGAQLGIMTFYPHPKEVLGKQPEAFRYLTPIPEKLSLFEQHGIDKAFIVEFTPEFASLSKEAFLDEILSPLCVTGVSTGFNFTFGRYATGTPDDLQVLGKNRFETVTVPPIMQQDQPISSSRIRAALSNGEIALARDMLGRPYRVKGNVIPGDQRGRLLGFPTANIRLEQPYYYPKLGVYIVDVWVPDLQLRSFGIMNVGIRPTFTHTEPDIRIEVHLLVQDLDLYGKELVVDLLHFLREEQRFPSFEHLKTQINQDRKTADDWIKQEAQANKQVPFQIY